MPLCQRRARSHCRFRSFARSLTDPSTDAHGLWLSAGPNHREGEKTNSELCLETAKPTQAGCYQRIVTLTRRKHHQHGCSILVFVSCSSNDALAASFFTPHHHSAQGIALRFLFLLLFWLIGSFQGSGLVLGQCHKQADDCGGVVCMSTLPMLQLKERSW